MLNSNSAILNIYVGLEMTVGSMPYIGLVT
uniref:Uncharacterized protein n=1 Tax=Rhizophora mucronata TaxID=61149 RepID=A0A2P2NJK6_RHIMU